MKGSAKDFVVMSGASFISPMPGGGLTIRNQETGVSFFIEAHVSGGLMITQSKAGDMSHKLSIEPASGNQIIIN